MLIVCYSLAMQLRLNSRSSSPIFQQIVEQIHIAISAGEIRTGEKLPSIRKVANDLSVAPNTVAKAFRQLEFRGIIEARDRATYTVSGKAAENRYQGRGVSADKKEVHRVVDKLDAGLFPGAFCKVTEDFLSGNPNKCNVIHADGAGTKSIIAYLWYKETGDARVFHGIAQDSIVMNLDDLICVGVNGRIVISNTINRNALNCPGEVISALIEGTEAFLENMRDEGVYIYAGGGETADVGDLTGTIIVDSCAVAIMNKAEVIPNDIKGNLAIIGLSSTGQSVYEALENSGIGSNGLTNARHDLLSDHYAKNYPEAFDNNIEKSLSYCGPYRLQDPLPGSNTSVGQAILSPTRTYAPVIFKMRQELRDQLKGIVHCSGGGQTKCLRFGNKVHFVKDNLFPTPPLFTAIQASSGATDAEMYQVFNMGHRMEVYVPTNEASTAIQIATGFGIEAKQVGYTEIVDKPGMTLTTPSGKQLIY